MRWVRVCLCLLEASCGGTLLWAFRCPPPSLWISSLQALANSRLVAEADTAAAEVLLAQQINTQQVCEIVG